MKTLEELRKAQGSTKGSVAGCIGVSYKTYQRYEADPRLMRVGDLAKVCEFLHCNMQDVFLPKDCN